MKNQVIFSIVFAILLVGVYSSEEDDWSAEEETCVDELKLNKENIQSLNKQDIVPEDNSDFNKFLHCYWKKKDVQDTDGEVDFDTLHKWFVVEFHKVFGKYPDIPTTIAGGMIKTAIQDCDKENIKGSTPGETAAKVQNCVFKKVIKAIEEVESSENV